MLIHVIHQLARFARSRSASSRQPLWSCMAGGVVSSAFNVTCGEVVMGIAYCVG
jgi:hypothetical protein